jgi:hypothetical protein
MIFKGEYSLKTKKPLKTADILYSTLRRKKFSYNKLEMKGSYIYHMYDSETESGRWYSTDFKGFRKYNEKERSVTHMIPEYEVWGTDKILKNVPVKIYFTENGWDKLMRL